MKTRGILGFAVMAGILGILATAVTAGAAFYNFDNLPSPGPTPLVLPGVTFAPQNGGGVIAEPGVPSASYPGNQVYSFNKIANSNPTLLTITFDASVVLVKFYCNANGANGPLVIDALDGNGKQLDSQYVSSNSGLAALVVLCSPGIKSVRIWSDGKAGMASEPYIDNFSFSRASGAAIIPLN